MLASVTVSNVLGSGQPFVTNTLAQTTNLLDLGVVSPFVGKGNSIALS